MPSKFKKVRQKVNLTFTYLTFTPFFFLLHKTLRIIEPRIKIFTASFYFPFLLKTFWFFIFNFYFHLTTERLFASKIKQLELSTTNLRPNMTSIKVVGCFYVLIFFYFSFSFSCIKNELIIMNNHVHCSYRLGSAPQFQ